MTEHNYAVMYVKICTGAFYINFCHTLMHGYTIVGQLT
jgi:hypothetical protein